LFFTVPGSLDFVTRNEKGQFIFFFVLFQVIFAFFFVEGISFSEFEET
jgi:hypothetical protein